MATPAVIEAQGGTAAAVRPGGGALGRVRRAAATPPGRLRTASAVLALLALLFGVSAVWQSATRSAAAGQVVTRSGPLNQDAAEIYRSLADADATAAAGFLLAGDETPEVRKRYQDDLATASRLLSQAAARSGSSASAQQWLTELNGQLPRYAGLVETARAISRQGLPLGGAYLRYASDLMQNTMLPNAQKLVDAESAQLDADYRTAGAVPWLALLSGLLALAALARYQRVLFRRTNRVFNPGLVAASVAMLLAFGWLGVGTLAVNGYLHDSRYRGVDRLDDLDRVRIAALQAHTAETLNLVSRGATDKYTQRWDELTKKLADSPRIPGSESRLSMAADEGTKKPLADADRWYGQWLDLHKNAATQDAAGDYDAAVQLTLKPGNADTADSAYRAADEQWARAAQVEQASFRGAAGGLDDLLVVQAAAAGVLAAVAATAAVRGIGRRLAEYR
ncbi:hypothetical protein AB0K51_10755 [Kitasatospora sp. NPDC049285]|uniref:hypothetical protein n=1 Tax=Kitasatospora sp. NPDC049285 TaxID=3157096 RepID=UPI00343F1716